MSNEQILLEEQIVALQNEVTFIQANVKPSLSMFFAHGYIYFFCWNVFVIIQIATARYMRDKW